MLLLTGEGLTIPRFLRALRSEEEVDLSAEAWRQVERSYRLLKGFIDRGDLIYGVNTGVGDLARITLPIGCIKEFQRNLLLSHAVTVGEPIPPVLVRGAMILRLNTFARGYSGVRVEVARLLLELLNRGIIPYVRDRGSLGASGDLALLASLALPLIGEGEVFYKGELIPSGEALAREGLKPIELEAKDGLSLINGTSFIASVGAFYLNEFKRQLKLEIILSALLIEALSGHSGAFLDELNRLRNSRGQRYVARSVRRFIRGSNFVDRGSKYIQDAYSLRCIPQIVGGIYDVLNFAWESCQCEMNTPSDNPLILLDEGRVISGGNFHAEGVSLAFDAVSVAACELGSISERHLNRLLDARLSDLPPFLSRGDGINSGLMLIHYTVSDILTENRVLAHPATADNASVSAQQEDHSSLGYLAVRKFKSIVENNWHILASELIAVLQALEMRNIEDASPFARDFLRHAREKIPFIERDRVMYPVMDAALEYAREIGGLQ